MRLVGTIFSGIFAFLAVPLFTMAACNLAVEAAFLNRDTYDSVLEDDIIFEEVLTVALPVIFTAPNEDEFEFEGRDEAPIQFREVALALEDKPEIWAEVTNLLVPPEWLQQTVTQFVDVLFAVTTGDFDVLDEIVDLTEVRQRFSGEEASEAARLIITEAPSCTEAQIEELNTFFSLPAGVMPICNPSNERTQQRSIDMIVLWFDALADHLGEDQPSVSDIYSLTKDNARTINTLVELDRQGLMLIYLCPMALLSLIIIFTVRSPKGFGRWIGGTSIASGVVILITIFVLQVAIFGIVTEALNTETAAEQFFARLFSEILRSAIAQSNSSMLLQAAIMIGIGFLLFVIAGFSGRQTQDNGNSVLIMEDGQIISTATQRRIGTLAQSEEDI